jgi:serine/threonine protein kinase/tetratricopeptide (TPR) repeat protein
VNIERWERLKEVFASALELQEGEREAFLRNACGDDDGLVAEIQALLSAHDSNPSESIELSVSAVRAAGKWEGRRIGPYRVIHRIGSGGMGDVYLAARADDAFNRRVAIKLVQTGIDTEQILKRFRHERQILAALDHPNIARLLDGGTTNDGLPYFVMDYVEGTPITTYCDTHKLSIPERIRLFRDVCLAVHYVHQSLVVHRDLKPNNILVTPDGVPKLLDFGIAKLLKPDFFGDPLDATRIEFRLMTPKYASPEQVRGEAVTSASDVYSLGVILYELLTSRRPYRLKTDSSDEIFQAVCDQEPEKPSTCALKLEHSENQRAQTESQSTAMIAQLRATVPERLRRELGGDLDMIVMKALRKEPQRRYSSAEQLSEDIRRHLEGLPVTAHGDTTRYRAGKFIRRHKAGVAAAGLVIILLIAGLLATRHWRQMSKLTDKDTIVLADFANNTGDAIFDDTLKTALSVSLRQSPFLNVLSERDVTKTLQLMTRPVNTKLTPEVTREVCQRAGSKAYIAGSIGGMGSEYVLGLEAVNCQSGDTLAEEQVTAASKEKVLNALGEVASKLRGELGESLATEQKFGVPLEQATTSSLEALKEYSLGIKAANEKDPATALPHNQRAIQFDPNFAMGYGGLGMQYFNLGELGRASEYLTKAFQLREHASEREKLTITANYYRVVTGELDKAAQAYQDEIESYPRELAAYNNLGVVFASLGQYEKAAEITRQALRLAPGRVTSYANLSNDVLALQHFDETRQIIREAQARKLDQFAIRNVLYALAFLGADSAAAVEQQHWFAGNPEYENYGLALASDTEAYVGHLRKARELTKRAVDSAIRADSKENGAIFQTIAAQREAACGNTAEARQSASEALKLAPGSQGAESEAALAFAMAGDAARAESLAQGLGKRFPLDTHMQSLWLPAIQAQLALKRKNPTAALDTLQASYSIELGQIPFVANMSCLYPVYVRGEAYLAAGQGNAAAAEFQKIIDHDGIVWNCWTGALAHLGVARANALQSRASQGADAEAARLRAFAAYKDFLTLWKDADPDIPILKEAKAEYTKLQ